MSVCGTDKLRKKNLIRKCFSICIFNSMPNKFKTGICNFSFIGQNAITVNFFPKCK